MQTLSKFFLVFGVFSAMAVTVFADFINGGFEDGNTTGWTAGGGTWAADNPSGANVRTTSTTNPNKSATIHDATGLVAASVADPNTLGNLYEVLQGNYSERVNNSDTSYHFSTFTQTESSYTNQNLYFGFAAVLEEPGNDHPQSAAPHFAFSIVDNTLGATLFSTAFNVYNAASTGIAWHDGKVTGGNTWKYSDWNVVHVDMTQYMNDSITVSVSAYDCGWGGHGGYAYVDSFQPTEPIPNPGVTMNLIEAANLPPPPAAAVPEPASVGLWVLGGLTLWGCGKLRKSRLAA